MLREQRQITPRGVLCVRKEILFNAALVATIIPQGCAMGAESAGVNHSGEARGKLVGSAGRKQSLSGVLKLLHFSLLRFLKN